MRQLMQFAEPVKMSLLLREVKFPLRALMQRNVQMLRSTDDDIRVRLSEFLPLLIKFSSTSLLCNTTVTCYTLAQFQHLLLLVSVIIS